MWFRERENAMLMVAECRTFLCWNVAATRCFLSVDTKRIECNVKVQHFPDFLFKAAVSAVVRLLPMICASQQSLTFCPKKPLAVAVASCHVSINVLSMATHLYYFICWCPGPAYCIDDCWPSLLMAAWHPSYRCWLLGANICQPGSALLPPPPHPLALWYNSTVMMGGGGVNKILLIDNTSQPDSGW